jgi:glycosyltransferase involved in cell wall biosynthesis
LKAALYYPWIHLTSGAERVILELSGRSRHDWTLFTSHFDPGRTFPAFAHRKVVRAGSVSPRRDIVSVAKSGWKILNLKLPLDGFDVLAVVGEGLGDLVVFRSGRIPKLCICLTPLRLVFDPEYRSRSLQKRGPLGRAALAAGSAIFRRIDRRAWNRYSQVFCISEEARRRAIAGGLGDAEKMEVLHLGLGFEPVEPSRRFDRFFLIAGRIMWTKNVQLGIEAFRRFRSAHPEHADFRLVVAGLVDEKSQPYLELLKQEAAGDPRIEFRFFPSDGELAELYRSCYAVLFTPFNEDWGIVPLEAMAFGKPVIAVNRGGPRETVRHGVNGFLEEPTPEAFASRMAELAGNERLTRSLGEAGPAHARSFDWNRFTSRIDDEIDIVCLAAAGRSPAPMRQRIFPQTAAVADPGPRMEDNS